MAKLHFIIIFRNFSLNSFNFNFTVVLIWFKWSKCLIFVLLLTKLGYVMKILMWIRYKNEGWTDTSVQVKHIWGEGKIPGFHTDSWSQTYFFALLHLALTVTWILQSQSELKYSRAHWMKLLKFFSWCFLFT